MSSNQEPFENFPQDDGLWAVKHIDQFHQAHEGTRSAAVKVMLQRLPPMSVAQLARMTEKSCQDVIGKRRDDPWPRFEFVEILVGSLPLVTVGFVFKNGVKVGQLPRCRKVIVLAPGEFDSMEFKAGEDTPPPQGWPENSRHRTLNIGEYAGVTDHTLRNVFFSKSRLWVHTRDHGEDKETYVVPRTTILKAFYAQHTEIAKVTCGRSWGKYLEEVICLNDIESGLRTEIIDGGRQWNIILRTLVPDNYAPILAVLSFDEYGRARAESLYTKSLQDMGGNPREPWYASAEIPLQAVNERLLLETRCIALKPRFFFDAAGVRREHRKFLVTEISGGSWPKHYPIIGHSRTNDANDSQNPKPVELDKPYSQPRKPRDGDPTTTLTQGEDAKAQSSTTTMRGGEWNWLHTPPVTIKLEKLFSNRYLGSAGTPKTDDETRVSTGAHTHEKDAVSKAEAVTLVRVSNERFERAIEVLEKLKKNGDISEIAEVAPLEPGQMSDRNGRCCWKFIDRESLINKRPPSIGWRAIYQNGRSSLGAVYRSALILRLAINGADHYWIEIECRPKDPGFRSVLLSGSGAGTFAILEATLDIIAEAKGRALKEKIARAFSHESVKVATYIHSYDKTRKHLTEESVKNFLTDATTTQ